jgi:hypothetical protein
VYTISPRKITPYPLLFLPLRQKVRPIPLYWRLDQKDRTVMCALRSLFLVCCLTVLCVRTSFADSLAASSVLGAVLHPPSATPQSFPVPPEGQIPLFTNGDGTISTALTDYSVGTDRFGFDSAYGRVDYDLAFPSAPLVVSGPADNFDARYLGFQCPDVNENSADCGAASIAWFIAASNASLTSADQAHWGITSSVDFDLNDNQEVASPLGKNRAASLSYPPKTASSVPEPGTFLLLATGLAGALGAVRHKLRPQTATGTFPHPLKNVSPDRAFFNGGG